MSTTTTNQNKCDTCLYACRNCRFFDAVFRRCTRPTVSRCKSTRACPACDPKTRNNYKKLITK